jgi:hypothetical protein
VAKWVSKVETGALISLKSQRLSFPAKGEGLLKASVAARNGSERILVDLGPGCVVGELSMIDGAPRSAATPL